MLTLAAVASLLRSAPPDAKVPADGFRQVARKNLEVTDGKVGEERDGLLTIDSPAARAVDRARTAQAARLVFTFHGPTKQESKLASGEVVHQIGLKLRARNGCNLLYVMWKLDDRERIAVSVKRNPGQSAHKDCGANGYMNIRPAFQEKAERFPSARDGKSHTLEAAVSKLNRNRYELVVKADGMVVWRGPIDANLLDDIDGPAGFRSDNGMFTFKFYTLAP
jgi:hypothetical protein